MKRILIFIFITLSVQVFSQLSRIDSLVILSRTTIDSNQKIKTFINLQIEYNEVSDFKNSLLIGDKALKLSKEIHDTLSTIIVLNNLGNTYSNQGSNNAAINFYSEALILSEKSKNSNYINLLYGALGVELTKQGETTKALNYLKKGLENNLKLKNKRVYPGFYNNLGILYRNLQQYNLAIENYSKSIKICKEINDKRVLMQTYNNLAFVYDLMKQPEEAMLYYNNSLDIAIELHDNFQEGIVLGNIGTLYFAKKMYKLAEVYFLKALKIASGLNDLEGEVENNLNLSKLYEVTGKPDSALYHLKKYIEKNNQLIQINNEKDRQAQEIKSEYEKEKIALKKEQEKRDLITNAEKNRQQYIIYSISIGFIIIAILLLFLYKRFKLTNSQKLIIENQKQLVEEKQKEILDSINYAKRIQDSLLQNFDSVNKFFKDSFVINKPKDIVSGDFYWLSKKIITERVSSKSSIVREIFFIGVCDSTGHGVPGGFMSLLNTSYLSEAINEKNILEPNKVFDYVRSRLINTISKNNQKDGFDGVLLCFEKKFYFEDKDILKTETSLTYAASNNAPVIVKTNILLDLETDKMPVGYGERNENFSLFSTPISENDIIYVFTDGYADQFGGPKGKKFKYKQLNDLLVKINSLSMEEQKEKLETTFNVWKGDLEQVDDVCIIGIKIN
jgi:tetratricopeptide (TPR) repeat protein